jgi:hypothetical protein
MLRLNSTNRSFRLSADGRSIGCRSIGWLVLVGGLLAVGAPAEAAKAKKVNPGGQQQAVMLAQQWRSCLLIELAFVRHICPDLPPRERVRVRAAAEKALQAAANELSGLQDQSESDKSTPQAMIRVAIAEKLRDALPPEKWKQFESEAEARVKRRQTAVIGLLVEHIDETLYLTPEQRNQIARALADHWKPAWEGWLQLRFMQGFPTLPRDVLTPYLDEEQRATCNKTQKIALSVQFITGQMPNDDVKETDWWDEAVTKPKQAGAAVGADVPPP